MLSKVFTTSEWGPTNHMYYCTIMGCKVSNSYSNGKKGLTTPMHEAKALVVWQNNYAKWIKLHSWCQLEENRGKPQPTLPGLWTTNEQGQTEYTAWAEEGLLKYQEAKTEIKNAWKEENMPKINELEKKMLVHLREMHGLVCQNHDEEKQLKKRNSRRAKRNQAAVDVKRRKIHSVVDDDDAAYE